MAPFYSVSPTVFLDILLFQDSLFATRNEFEFERNFKLSVILKWDIRSYLRIFNYYINIKL